MSGSRTSDSSYKIEEIGPRVVEIPKDWDVVRLGDDDVTEWVTQGPNPDYSKGDPSESYRAIKTKDLYDEGILYENADEISEENVENQSKYILRDGDILIAIVGRGSIGKTYLFNNQTDCKYIFTRAIGLVRVNQNKLLPLFLHHYFQSHDAKQHFYQSITGSTGQEVLRTSAVKAMPIPLPPLPEQCRIADILSTVDEQIQQTDRLIKEARELRRGISSDLLTHGISGEQTKSTPVGPVPSSWKLRRGQELVSLRNGKYISSDERMEHADYPVYGGNGIMGRYNDWLVDPDSIIIGRVGAYCGNIHLTESKAWVTDNAIIAQVNHGEVNPQFLAEVLRRAGLRRFASRSAQPRISQSAIKSLSIPLPNKQEQDKIVEILATVDKYLKLEKDNERYHQELKRGLMQDLLTGEVRVNPKTTD